MTGVSLDEHLKKCAELVNAELERLFPATVQPEALAKSCRHLFRAGGKRLRPCLVLTSCEAVGGSPTDAMETAAAIEMLHTFTLIHDDIMDRDEFRRNIRTVHVIWGEPIAIVAGDALFAKVFQAVAENVKRLELSKERAVKLFSLISTASFQICQGQTMDMLFESREDVGEDKYLEMVSEKTGALMGASTRAGALLGGGSKADEERLGRYGRLLGMAFQIHDDILGVIGKREKFGKPIGSDIREGKKTLIMVHALKHVNERQKKLIMEVLGKRDASERQIKDVIEILKKTGSTDYARERAMELAKEAKSELKGLKSSGAKKLLEKLVDFTVKREV